MRPQLALVFVASLSAAATIAEQDAANAQEVPARVSHRELNGHVFVPSLLVDTPFRTTTFQVGLVYAAGTATGPKYDINGNETGTADYTMAGLGQTFSYENRVADWLAVGGSVITLAYTGINGPSVVSVGAQVGVGAAANVRVGHRFGPVEATVLMDASYQPEYGFLVAAAILRALQDHVLDPGAALQTSHSWTLRPTLAASWAPFAPLGLTGNLGYVYKSTLLSGTVTENNSALLAGIAADFDFGKITSTAIGLLASYRLNEPLTDGLPRIQDFSGGISYTGRPDLGLTLELGRRTFSIRPGLPATAGVAQLGLQYYW